MALENPASHALPKTQLNSMAFVVVEWASLWMEEISMNVLWILIYVPMEFVRTYVVVTVVTATVAMNQMPLEETVLTSMSAW